MTLANIDAPAGEALSSSCFSRSTKPGMTVVPPATTTDPKRSGLISFLSVCFHAETWKCEIQRSMHDTWTLSLPDTSRGMHIRNMECGVNDFRVASFWGPRPHQSEQLVLGSGVVYYARAFFHGSSPRQR